VGGDTVAVLGTGIDVPYPPEHDELFQTVAERGCAANWPSSALVGHSFRESLVQGRRARALRAVGQRWSAQCRARCVGPYLC
jgi:hypothetical protein